MKYAVKFAGDTEIVWWHGCVWFNVKKGRHAFTSKKAASEFITSNMATHKYPRMRYTIVVFKDEIDLILEKLEGMLRK